MLSQRQAKNYLLCAICAERFNNGAGHQHPVRPSDSTRSHRTTVEQLRAVDHRTRGRVPMGISYRICPISAAHRYYVRSAVAGSTCVARRRGMSSAIVAQQMRIATATPSAMGSNGGTS